VRRTASTAVTPAVTTARRSSRACSTTPSACAWTVVRSDQSLGQRDRETEEFRKRKPAGRDERGKRLPLNEFHGKEAEVVFILDGEERDDIRMVEPGNRPGFSLEASNAVVI